MNITRNGKIARLPKAVREELNQRLTNGETGRPLVKWLNSLPEVRAVMEKEFGGNMIREQNLSEWRQGGYGEWSKQQEVREVLERITANGNELTRTANGPITDKLALWLAARYLVTTRKLEEEVEAEAGWNRLREFCKDLAMLRRNDHQAERLRLKQEKFTDTKKDEQARALELCLADSKNYPEVMEQFKAAFEQFKKAKAERFANERG